MLGIALMIVVLTALVYHVLYKKETFLTVILFRDKLALDIVVPNGETSPSLETFVAKTDSKYKIVTETALADAAYYTNTADIKVADKAMLACTDDVNTACFVKGFFSQARGDDISDLIGRRIGYINDQSLSLAHKILRICGINPDSLEFVRSTIEEAAKELERPTRMDALFLFVNLKNTEYSRILEQKLTVFSLTKLDHDVSRFLLPQAIVRNADVRLHFKNSMDQARPIRTLFEFNNVLMVPRNTKLTYLHKVLAQYFDHNAEYMAHLERFKGLTKHPELKMSTHEHFEERPFTIVPKTSLPGYYDDTDKTFTLETDVIDGIPLRQGDTVLLKNQEKAHERGDFVTIAVANGKAILERRHPAKEPRDPETDETFYCVTNESIKRKEECRSIYDNLGNQKKSLDVWDAPCRTSDECPFFQRNKNYKNYRGGCVDGYCEMPIGVQRVGFKNYTGQPLCHGCPTTNLACCESQSTPDYAFPVDEFEREAQGLRQSISPSSA